MKIQSNIDIKDFKNNVFDSKSSEGKIQDQDPYMELPYPDFRLVASRRDQEQSLNQSNSHRRSNSDYADTTVQPTQTNVDNNIEVIRKNQINVSSASELQMT